MRVEGFDVDILVQWFDDGLESTTLFELKSFERARPRRAANLR